MSIEDNVTWQEVTIKAVSNGFLIDVDGQLLVATSLWELYYSVLKNYGKETDEESNE